MERDFEGVVVVGVGVWTSTCAVEAATRLIVHWSDLSRVLKVFVCIPLVKECIFSGADAVGEGCRSAIGEVLCREVLVGLFPFVVVTVRRRDDGGSS